MSIYNRLYIIAEMSGNHNRDFNRATQLIHKAAQASAVKLQTHTTDTITTNQDQDPLPKMHTKAAGNNFGRPLDSLFGVYK